MNGIKYSGIPDMLLKCFNQRFQPKGLAKGGETPALSLPKLMSSLEQYGLYSGYKLNLRTKPFLITFSHKIMLIKYIISNGKQML
jgi:hypothetical protein